MVSEKARKTVRGVPAAVGAVAGVKSVRAAVADASAQAQGLVDELNERLVPALHDAGERLGPVIATARERIGGTVEDVVVPVLHDAGERLAPVIATARVRAGETARDVGGRLVDRAEPYAHEAARRGGNALEALKGSEVVAPARKKRGGVFRGLLIVSGLGGLSYAAWRALAGSRDDPWTDSVDTGGLVDKVKQTAGGVADTVRSKVAGAGDAPDDGSPSAEEGAFVSDLGTFATEEPVVVTIATDLEPGEPLATEPLITEPLITEPLITEPFTTEPVTEHHLDEPPTENHES